MLGLKLNRVTLADGGGPGPGGAAAALLGGGKKSYEVDDKDFFWEMCGGMPFPKVGESEERGEVGGGGAPGGGGGKEEV